MSSGSRMRSSTRYRGSSVAYGSWKMTWMCRDSARRSRAANRVMFSPLNRIDPLVGSIRPRIIRPSVLLPEPDSPTTETVSPAASVSVRSRTATSGSAARPASRAATPLRDANSLRRAVTCSKAGCAVIDVLLLGYGVAVRRAGPAARPAAGANSRAGARRTAPRRNGARRRRRCSSRSPVNTAARRRPGRG